MKFHTLDNFDFSGKRVLLRADLNSEVTDGKVVLNDRLIESAKTISELKKKGARVVILAHQGTPGKSDCISLKSHAKLLNKFVKVKFVKDIIGKKALSEIDSLENGEVLLLENVRFLKEEFSPSIRNKFVKALVSRFDIFINDAFSVSHREQTSLVSFAKVLPSGIGRIFEKEISAAEKLKIENALCIFGGEKIEGNILLAKKARRVLATGVFALFCLKARGFEIGKSEENLKKYNSQLGEIKKLRNKISVPSDLAENVNGKRSEIFVGELPSKYFLWDIGKKTVENYLEEISRAKSIYVRGPAGMSEYKNFSFGTRKIFEAVAKSKAFTFIGGGHTVSAMRKMGINKNKFDYVSLSGGAMEEYLAGKKLPGIEALKIK